MASTAGKPTAVRDGVLANFPPFQVWPRDSCPGGADVEMFEVYSVLLVHALRQGPQQS